MRVSTPLKVVGSRHLSPPGFRIGYFLICDQQRDLMDSDSLVHPLGGMQALAAGAKGAIWSR